jgi:hypothetical protein
LFSIDVVIFIDLTNKSIKSTREQGEIPPYNNSDSKEIIIGYVDQRTQQKRQQCYPTVWLDRQLVFAFKYRDFESGDSGADKR